VEVSCTTTQLNHQQLCVQIQRTSPHELRQPQATSKQTHTVKDTHTHGHRHTHTDRLQRHQQTQTNIWTETDADRTRLNSLLRRGKRLGYCRIDQLEVADMFSAADDDFLSRIKSNSHHEQSASR